LFQYYNDLNKMCEELNVNFPYFDICEQYMGVEGASVTLEEE